DLDARTQLSEYGFDSIAYTGLANRIGEQYGIDLSPAIFFDFPTVAGIAGYLIEQHPASFAAAPAPAAPPAPVAAPVAAPPVVPAVVPVVTPPVPALASTPRSEPIAVVGMSGSFPMAPDLQSFWNNLEQGRDCIGEIPLQRWDWQAIHADPADKPNSSDVKWGGFMDGVDEFDPLFFGISPREALMMDPQQRLLMTHVWQAIEDAGHAPSSLAGSSTGAFIGTASTGYDSVLQRAGLPIEGFSATGVVPSVGPNRMSYLLDLRGPSEPIETACSSSLVAIHRAVLAIEAGDCEQAIVGGVNTIVAPDLHISFNKAGMLAKDGRCKTFSSTANGYVRGEGAGVLFLKKLSAAQADGNHIYGLIRGSAENHGGRANSLTAPNSRAQAEVLVKAYRKAGIHPATVTYLEAHGTGTPLGDPVEVNGIKQAFAGMDAADASAPPCALASVKTNIGHLELAAGVAGVIKVLLQMRHRRIAPSLHCAELNSLIDLSGTRFHVARTAQDWTALRDPSGAELPRRAGVSSFGFGGVNAHVVLEEYLAPTPAETPLASPVLIVLSARNAAALRRYAERLHDAVSAEPAPPLADLAYTLQVGRDAMDERLGVVVRSIGELRDKLRAFLDGKEDIEDLYLGQVGRNRETLGAYANDEDLQQTMALWIAKGKYGKFFGMWVKGVSFDWRSLHGAAPGRRISAPTYPFAREKLWPAAAAAAAAPAPAPVPTPPAAIADPVLEALQALERGVVSIDDAIGAIVHMGAGPQHGLASTTFEETT
ncbi:MAG: beta-ketoacyl synthase N-terminal-like domain-containing protein, partial [Gammaproteobacteria bacterium]